jgi:hypothetical protein
MKPLMKKVKAEYANDELVAFAKTIDFTELFDHINAFTGISCGFKQPVVQANYCGVYINFMSWDIGGQTGPFAVLLKRCYFHSFNNSVYKDRETGEPGYMAGVRIHCQHKDGSSNGLDVLRARYRSGVWEFLDAGYEMVNTRAGGYRLNAQVKNHGWIDGAIDGFRFHAKVCGADSQLGINNGRVSKLEMRSRQTGGACKRIAKYDKGWEKEPANDRHRELFEALLGYLEEIPAEKCS